MSAQILSVINNLSLGYFVAVNGVYLALTVLAFVEIRQQWRALQYSEERLLYRYAAVLKPVSILAPAYNEELSVADSVRALLALNYPEFEVILVNDGSRDHTLERMVEVFQLRPSHHAPTHQLPTQAVRGVWRSAQHPNLVVIDKENGGKADALNAGINHSRYSLCLAIDTDSLLAKDALLKMVRPFMERPETVAVGGLIRVVNGCVVRDGEVVDVRLPRSVLANVQVIEYFRAFLFGRAGWGRLNMLLIVSGAFGMFRTAEVIAAGGYWTATVGEDVELIVRLHRRMREQGRRYAIRFISDPVCWTEVPESYAVLRRQRDRWARGLLQAMHRHRVMFGNPRYGRLGLIALPFNLVVEALGSVVELGGMGLVAAAWYLGQVEPRFLLAFLAAAFLLGVIVSWSAAARKASRKLIQPRLPRLSMLLQVLAYAVLEGAVFRYVNGWWRIRGLISFLRGEQGWGRIVRTGFARN